MKQLTLMDHGYTVSTTEGFAALLHDGEVVRVGGMVAVVEMTESPAVAVSQQSMLLHIGMAHLAERGRS